MSDQELIKYTDSMIAQQNQIKEGLYDLSIYGNGSISLETLYNMPLQDIYVFQNRLSKKLKEENNLNQTQYL